ncbi:Alpha/beta hydrolase fold-3 [Cynara cardunculus var. scolymus]|uniref:Alpha/beta hydrolase fold-3 n=2 Tax=Cynara cardunculus var. scolymus TaxID=59895 RepID=A0A103XVC9_CYNCS|nr:Alpha/beta hydrolase fold-3 [Cynara cardunculus var. scolymus]
MGIISLDSTLSLPMATQNPRVVVEEIGGLIRVYKDGHVERPHIVPRVMCTLPPELGVTCRDLVIDKFTKVWARFYVPKRNEKLPLLVYFHGGGFCVGSAAWSCYHEFLAILATKVGCVIMSVDYRLAPENPLPAAYEDGQKALMWLKQQALSASSNKWWLNHYCDFSSVFLGGDSAGGNIAHNVTLRLGADWAQLKPLILKGNILIQPFFGGEARMSSEKFMVQPPGSALNLEASDTYWRLSLPKGANRDHEWCNPGAKRSMKWERMRYMVCVSEMDILKDRNMEFGGLLRNIGIEVEDVVYKGVGHAFQILDKSQVSQVRTQEMIADIKAFININININRNRR